MLTVVTVIAVFLALMWFFTADTYLSERAAGEYPFAMIVLGLVFLYPMIASAETYLKWVSGIFFLICGFACMQDVSKIRRTRHRAAGRDKEV